MSIGADIEAVIEKLSAAEVRELVAWLTERQQLSCDLRLQSNDL